MSAEHLITRHAAISADTPPLRRQLRRFSPDTSIDAGYDNTATLPFR